MGGLRASSLAKEVKELLNPMSTRRLCPFTENPASSHRRQLNLEEEKKITNQ
jgi:hypothetical protein